MLGFYPTAGGEGRVGEEGASRHTQTIDGPKFYLAAGVENAFKFRP